MAQGVVAEVVAEGALRPPLVGRDVSLHGELGLGQERVRVAVDARAAHLAALQQRGQHQLGHVLGQRTDRRQDQRRGAAHQQGEGQGPALPLGGVVVEAAPLLYLPVHAEGALVVPLHAVHAEVVVAGFRVLGVDQGEGDEVAAVLGPGLEQGQPRQVGLRLAALGDGGGAHRLQAHPQRLPGQPPPGPQLARRQIGQVLGEVDQLAQEPPRPRAEGQLHPPRRAEEVGHAREVGALDVAEQQRRAASGDDPAVDLGDLEVGGDRRLHVDDLLLTPQQVQELAEVGHGAGR